MPDRGGGANGRDAGRVIGKAAAVEHLVRRECADLAGGPIDPDARVHLEGVTFDAALKLLIAIMSKSDRTAGKEHRRQRHVERERRVVAPAEAAADIGELRVDAVRPERSVRLAKKIRDRLGGFERRLHAEHQLELACFFVVPAEAGFRLEKHRIDRLRLEFAVEHQQRRIVRGQFRPDLLAIVRAFGIGGRVFLSERRPNRKRRVLEFPRTDPTLLNRRINVGRIAGGAGHSCETKLTVVRHLDGSRLLAELHERAVTQRKPRLIECVEGFEDQQRDRLAHIDRRLAQRAEQVAGVEFRNARARLGELVGGHDHRGFQSGAQAREIDANIHVGGVGSADEYRVRRARRPARKIARAKIGGVKLRAGDFDDAVNAAGTAGGWVPVVPPGQNRARRKLGLCGKSQPRHAERNAAHRYPSHKLASRRPHATTSWRRSRQSVQPRLLSRGTPTSAHLADRFDRHESSDRFGLHPVNSEFQNRRKLSFFARREVKSQRRARQIGRHRPA